MKDDFKNRNNWVIYLLIILVIVFFIKIGFDIGVNYANPCLEYSTVQASSSGDVIVIIKKNNKVYSHAYIKAGGYYKFKLGNGLFQTFFYYVKGWNPDKLMKKTICGDVTGGPRSPTSACGIPDYCTEYCS